MSGPVLVQPRDAKPGGIATFFQVLALGFGCLAAAWGVFCVYGAAFPGPCGDNPGPGLGVIEAFVVDIPLGLLALAVGLFVRKGSPLLRKICIATAVVTLSLPFIAGYFLQRWHCP
jgi:hypothetical protein